MNQPRDKAELHQKKCVQRGIHEQQLSDWQAECERIGERDQAIYPAPPWAYVPHGKLLRTPVLPTQSGFVPPPIDPDDLLETKLLLSL